MSLELGLVQILLKIKTNLLKKDFDIISRTLWGENQWVVCVKFSSVYHVLCFEGDLNMYIPVLEHYKSTKYKGFKTVYLCSYTTCTQSMIRLKSVHACDLLCDKAS